MSIHQSRAVKCHTTKYPRNATLPSPTTCLPICLIAYTNQTTAEQIEALT
jgi:hypothetical protein